MFSTKTRKYKYDNEKATKTFTKTQSHLQEEDKFWIEHDQEKVENDRRDHLVTKRNRRRNYDTRVTRQNSNPLVYLLSVVLRTLSMLVIHFQYLCNLTCLFYMETDWAYSMN